MSAPPSLSVVTVTTDDTQGLRYTLASLAPLAQTWDASEWEHVVVDGSPTLNAPLLAAVPAGWPLVHVPQTPRGVPHAFNAALAVARGRYLWFLNGGDGLRSLAALQRALGVLEQVPAIDFVGGGAYLRRDGRDLYPVLPWPSLVANVLGRSWMYHQTVIYRRTSVAALGEYSGYRVASDYDYHVRAYASGLRWRRVPDVLVDYDMTGGSSDPAVAFEELRRIHRANRPRLPAWVNRGNEVIRTLEYFRISAFRGLSATRLGARLRPLWWGLRRLF